MDPDPGRESELIWIQPNVMEPGGSGSTALCHIIKNMHELSESIPICNTVEFFNHLALLVQTWDIIIVDERRRASCIGRT